MAVSEISIQPGEIPVCPCGECSWIVRQRIERESPLVRVDGFGDVVVEKHDRLLYQQSIVLECKACKALHQPQSGLYGKCDAYAEGTEKEVLLAEIPEDPDAPLSEFVEDKTGEEDTYGWPEQIPNEVLFEEGEFPSEEQF